MTSIFWTAARYLVYSTLTLISAIAIVLFIASAFFGISQFRRTVSVKSMIFAFLSRFFSKPVPHTLYLVVNASGHWSRDNRSYIVSRIRDRNGPEDANTSPEDHAYNIQQLILRAIDTSNTMWIQVKYAAGTDLHVYPEFAEDRDAAERALMDLVNKDFAGKRHLVKEILKDAQGNIELVRCRLLGGRNTSSTYDIVVFESGVWGWFMQNMLLAVRRQINTEVKRSGERSWSERSVSDGADARQPGFKVGMDLVLEETSALRH